MAQCKTFWMNVYRSGWFHRQGKPGVCDIHAGDFYEDEKTAKEQIDPPSHYLCTVPVELPVECRANPPDSVPVPLSVSRKA